MAFVPRSDAASATPCAWLPALAATTPRARKPKTADAATAPAATEPAVPEPAATEPHVPDPLRPLVEDPTVPVVHAADYLRHRDTLLAAGHVTVIGTGQSGAEIFLDLLRHRPAGRERLHWLGRTEALAPMEYSKLGLEHFTPDYTRYFHGLAEPVRDRLVAAQWQLHKGIDADTTAAIHDELYRRTLDGGWPDAALTPGVTVRTAGRIGTHGIELHLEHGEQGTRTRLITDAVVLATGYRERPLDQLLEPLDPYIRRDAAGRPRVGPQHRVVLDRSVTGRVYVQNAERHSHGVGAPDQPRQHVLVGQVAADDVLRLHGQGCRVAAREQPHPPASPSQRRRDVPADEAGSASEGDERARRHATC